MGTTFHWSPNLNKAKAKTVVNMDVVYTVWAETLSLGWRRDLDVTQIGIEPRC